MEWSTYLEKPPLWLLLVVVITVVAVGLKFGKRSFEKEISKWAKSQDYEIISWKNKPLETPATVEGSDAVYVVVKDFVGNTRQGWLFITWNWPFGNTTKIKWDM